MIPRTLEPEVMDTREEAVDYNSMDHSDVNRRFVDRFITALDDAGLERSTLTLDVGTGTALIPIELCRRGPEYRVTAIDLAGEMLKVAQDNIAEAQLADQITIERVDAKQMPYTDSQFDAVMSNSIIHHIPEPETCFADIIRVLRPGGLLFVRDLMRPDDGETVEHIVQAYAGDENQHQQQMFRDSLHAALTLEEVRAMLKRFGLIEEWAQQTTDRHWTICGVML
ncbi:MAG: SAM-dependent methyltransferase [Planctomycetaceae bacterium]|nr:SAM-dependent methyltransferase [Planctomycetaceae bacterium]